MKSLTISRLWVSVVAAATLAGCSLAPDYKRPDAPIAANWPDQPLLGEDAASGKTGTQAATAVAPEQGIPAADIGWREFFHDQRLQKLIELSLVNNRDMRIAVQRIEEARALYGQQRGEQFPSIGVGVQGTRQRLPEALRQPGQDAVTAQYQGGLALTAFEIDLFGRLRNLSEAARQQYLQSEQARRSVQINLVGQVAQAYFSLRAADTQLDLVRRTLESRQSSFDLVNSRFEGGVASELELNQSRTLLNTATSNLAQFTRERAQAVNLLVVLIGQQLPSDLPEALPFGSEQLVATVPAGLPSDLLARRPDILGAENALQAANANIGAARAAFFPTISLTGQLGSASGSLSNLFEGGTGFWSFSPQIAAPLFAGGSLRAGVDLARARENIAVSQYEQAIQQAFREVSDALAGEATYGAQLTALRALEASSARTVELSNLRYEGGIDDFLQVQTAQVEYFNAQQSLVQTGLQSLINRTELYKALGGGWVETSIPQAQAQPGTPVANASGQGGTSAQ
ncbi:RND efflux system, outer membrane lipoprotein CmeC [plant metagenome]|uniref:RND efflux system, outer membrane lipoprotein CmeC n=1 Tax=plant metagenome TaxID=1297885 RepID=A0A484SPU3_9ZZZZ